MAKDLDHSSCGMGLCGKCSPIVAVFGVLFLVAGFGLWGGAPAWFNGWTLAGLYLLLWGGASLMKSH